MPSSPRYGEGCSARMGFYGGVLSIVGGRGSRHFDGEMWAVVIEELPPGFVDEVEPVCDECIMSLVERGAVKRVEP